MQFIDFHSVQKSLRDNIGTQWSSMMEDMVKLMEQQQQQYLQERDAAKVGYEDIIKALLSGEMSVEDGKTRIVMTDDGVEVLDPEPK